MEFFFKQSTRCKSKADKTVSSMSPSGWSKLQSKICFKCENKRVHQRPHGLFYLSYYFTPLSFSPLFLIKEFAARVRLMILSAISHHQVLYSIICFKRQNERVHQRPLGLFYPNHYFTPLPLPRPLPHLLPTPSHSPPTPIPAPTRVRSMRLSAVYHYKVREL